MARISGVDLPRAKRIEVALTYIYGIGRPTANKILATTGIDRDTNDLAVGVSHLRQCQSHITHRLHAGQGVFRQAAHMGPGRLMAEDQRVGLAAVDQRHGHA